MRERIAIILREKSPTLTLIFDMSLAYFIDCSDGVNLARNLPSTEIDMSSYVKTALIVLQVEREGLLAMSS